MAKKPREKTKYSLVSNVKFALNGMWEYNKGITLLIFLYSPFTVLTSILAIFLSQQVVSAVEINALPTELLTIIGTITLLIIVAGIITAISAMTIESYMLRIDFSFSNKVIQTFLSNDYQVNESAKGLDRYTKAKNNVGSEDCPTRRISLVLAKIFANFLGIGSYATLLFFLNPIIVFVIAITTLGTFWILKRDSQWSYKNKDNWQSLTRKTEYVQATMGDFSKAKDLRIYGLGEWFIDVFKETFSRRMGWRKKELIYNFKNNFSCALLALVRDVISYGLLVYILIERNATGADFVYYFGLVGGFSTWLSSMVTDFTELVRHNVGFIEIREFLDFPNETNRGEGIALPKESFSFEFKNVYFRYDGSEVDTIKNLNFKIKKGEKIALVGVNGAGKTTLVKLICGLYKPNSGEILIDGNSINKYNIFEYYSLFSVVFQDIFILPQSIRNNIVGGDYKDFDNEKLEKVIEFSGLNAKFNSLPNGLDTNLVKTVHEEAVEFSGGEMQRLALARALYKDGKALILDEPTAALDPIAESKIYERYNEMTKGHTSIFISHRLASTRFCDRIFMFEKGKIIEEGTHQNLMEKGGKYAKMFEVQSHYYKENEENAVEVEDYEF